MSGVFISYRRDDARGWAPALHRVLTRHFASENVFYDRRTLQGGDDWFGVIRGRISTADAVVVLIGPDWVGPGGGQGTNRLAEPQDVVRREIELALDAGRWIVPVLLDGRTAPKGGDVPDSMQRLLALHMMALRPDIFEEDAERLLTMLLTRLQEPGQIRQSIRRRKFAWLIEELLTGFGGRTDALTHIQAFLGDPTRKALLLKAPAGFGKTSLVARVIGDADTACAFHLFNAAFDADSVKETDFLASMVEQMMAWQGLREQVLASDLSWLKGRFASLLETLPARDHVVVLDGLDEIDGAWDVRPYITQLRSSVRVLASARTGGPSDEAYGFGLAESYVLGGFSIDEVKDVLAAAGPKTARLAGDANIVLAVAKVAASEEAGVAGSDPFVVRFIARDLEQGDLSVQDLASVQSSGLTAYLNRWLDQIAAATKDDERPLRLLALLATARAPLSAADLNRLLPPIPNRMIQPRLEQTLQPVRRFVMTIPEAEFQLVHSRLAAHFRQHLDIALTREQLIAYCLDWPAHHSPYAIRWLVSHLIGAGRLDDAWTLITGEAPDGRNAWYTAEAAAGPSTLENDRVAWYLDDLALLRDAFVRFNQPLERLVVLALLQGSVAAISERVPNDLLALMASLDEGLRRRAVTLAKRRPGVIERLRGLAAVLTHVDDPRVQHAIGADVVATAAALQGNPYARSEVLMSVASRLSPDLARRAVDLVLESVSEPLNVEAAAALATQLPEADAAQVHADLWTSIHKVTQPLEQAELLGRLARLELPDAERATTEALGIVGTALENPPDSKPLARALASALSELARVVELPWRLLELAIGALDQDDQLRYFTDLLAAPGAAPVIPVVNHLIELNSSEARGRAFAAAMPRLTDADAQQVVSSVSWDWVELSWVVPSLPEALRANVAGTLLEKVLAEAPSNHAQVDVLARLVPFLADADRARAIEFMNASAAMVSVVPPHEELGRQAAEMLRVTNPETGQAVGFEVSAGPCRADSLTLVAKTVEGDAVRDAIERALHAADAIDDRLHGAVLVATLSRAATPEDTLRLQFAAVDAITSIEWDATRADGIGRVAPWLVPEAREYALAKDPIEAPEAQARAEAALLASRRPLTTADVARLMELLPEAADTHAVAMVEAMRDLLSDEQVALVLDTALTWEKDETVSATVAALAPRIPKPRAFELVTSRPWSLRALDALLERLSDTDGKEVAASILSSVTGASAPVTRTLGLTMLLRRELAGLDEASMHVALEAAVKEIDASAQSNMVAVAALALPEGSASRTALIDAVLSRPPQDVDADEWAEALATLDAAIPAARIGPLIDGLAALPSGPRSVALDGLSAAIAAHLSKQDQRAAAIHVLGILHGDERRNLLTELSAMQPVLVSLLTQQECATLADDVLRLERWFA